MTATHEVKGDVDPKPADPALGSYLTGKVKEVTDDEMTALFGRWVTAPGKPETFGANDPISSWVDSKGFAARTVAKVLTNREKSVREKTGQPDLNTLFILNMPPRAMSKMTQGMIDSAMVQAIVKIANRHTFPEYTEEELAQMGPIKRWIKTHPNIWEFILFNILSNVSTIARFVVTWIGTAIFVTGMGLTTPFHFLIFNYDEQGNGLGGFLTFLCAEVIAQVVNFFVQMKWVFKSDSSFKDAAWKYAILAVIIVVVNLVLPGYVTGLCQGWGMGAGLAGTVASVVNTLLAVIVSYPLLKFWIMPKNNK